MKKEISEKRNREAKHRGEETGKRDEMSKGCGKSQAHKRKEPV